MFRSTLLKQQSTLLTAAMRPSLFRPAAARSVMAVRGFISQPPGGIVGTVNDPVAIPPPSKTHGSLHWTAERLLIIGFVPLMVAPLAGGALNPVLDGTLGTLLLLHSHLGFESCIIDYIPKRVYGPFHNLALYALYAGTATALFGLYQIETKDIGIAATVGKIWHA
ncbi:hypothetical protein DV451_002583 [Geotrichum candidum]|uniref:Succinate dehydrogenase [ubiquinone] cytochrome b small subunit n=1 Tax=Geotrichum candidum TaxID=1173061 RepID=A0A9P5G4K5_GEOCN|nr:hypothetical protein DV451_002583 [Geotrichum candidum]KAF5106089.1 hypothetical protein DV453_004206 [Geotrichum candidum]